MRFSSVNLRLEVAYRIGKANNMLMNLPFTWPKYVVLYMNMSDIVMAIQYLSTISFHSIPFADRFIWAVSLHLIEGI